MKLADISGKKEKAYLKAKIEKFETNSKIKHIRESYRGISDFKKDYQPRTNIIRDEKGDLVTDCHSILARWRNHTLIFSMHMSLVMLGKQKYTQQNH